MIGKKGLIIIAVTAVLAISALPYFSSRFQIPSEIQNEDGSLAYITNSRTNEVLIVDLTKKAVKQRIQTGGPDHKGPFGIDIMPDGGLIYITNPGQDNVLAINTTNHEIEATIPVGRWPTDVVISPDGTHAYVVCSDSYEVHVIKTENNIVESIVNMGGQLGSADITSDGEWLYVTVSDSVAVINTETRRVMDTIDVGAARPSDVVLTPDGRYAYVASEAELVNRSHSIYVIDTGFRTVVDVIEYVTIRLFPDSTLDGLAVSPDGSILYAVDLNGYTLAVIDMRTNKIIRKMEAKLPDTYGGPRSVTFSPDGRFAYLLYWGGVPIDTPRPDIPSYVAVVDTNTHTIIASIKLGKHAGANRMVISP